MLFEPKRGWRHIEVSKRRRAVDFALEMRKLVERSIIRRPRR
jgi:hypothetical protein